MPGTRIRSFVDITDAPSVRLLSIGWADLFPDSWNDRRAESGFWTLYRNSESGTTITTRAGATPLAARKAYLLPPNTAFARHNRQATAHLYAYFEILGLSATAMPPIIPVPAELHGPWLTALAGTPRRPTPAACVRLSALILSTIEPFVDAARIVPASDRAEVAPALAAMRDDPAHPWSLAELAERCGCAAPTFGRRFHAALGCPPMQWLREHRSHLVAHRLATGDDSLERLAREVGFGSRPYLSRVFRAVIGIGPGEYRQALRRGVHPLGPHERWS